PAVSTYALILRFGAPYPFLLYFLSFLLPRLLPRPTPFPYTTLFRSIRAVRTPTRGPPGAPSTHRSRRCADSSRVPPIPAPRRRADRKSTRLNSSHVKISYAVFCLKKKKSR